MGFLRFRNMSTASAVSVDPSNPLIRAEDVAVWVGQRQVLELAAQDAERVRDEAKKGYQAELERGYKAGMEQVRDEQAAHLIDNAARMVEYFAGIEQRIVGLVTESVRRIISDFDDKERVLAVVRNGLAVMRNQKQLTLRLAPEHVDMVRARARELLASFPGVGILDIVPDARLRGDAAILESEIGMVEASIESQIQALEAGFSRMLGSRV